MSRAIRQNKNGTKTLRDLDGSVYVQGKKGGEFRPAKINNNPPALRGNDWEPVPAEEKPSKARRSKVEEAVISKIKDALPKGTKVAKVPKGADLAGADFAGFPQNLLTAASSMRQHTAIQTLADLSLEFLRRGNIAMASEVATALVRYMGNGEES